METKEELRKEIRNLERELQSKGRDVKDLQHTLIHMRSAISGIKSPGRGNWKWALEYLGFINEEKAMRTSICALIWKERIKIEDQVLKTLRKKYPMIEARPWLLDRDIMMEYFSLEYGEDGKLQISDKRDGSSWR